MKQYLGKSAEPIQVVRGGTMTPAVWLVRMEPHTVVDGVAVATRFALTYYPIRAGDHIVDSTGCRWLAIEVATSNSGDGPAALHDVRMGSLD